MSARGDRFLSGIRVLEVSSERTMFAGQLLADFGAEVVLLEPPGGARGRRIPPFAADRPGLDRGLLWMSVNRGKRSCTLDAGTADGRALLRKLAHGFDVVIYEASGAAAAALDDADLGDGIRCILHPFDPDGPKRDYAATELVLAAASGSAALNGKPTGRPLFFPTPQALFEIGSDAAVALIAALSDPANRPVRRVEVVERGAVLAAAFSEPLVVGAGGGVPPTEASNRSVGLPNTYAASDGYVQVSLVFGTSFDPKMTGLARWLADEGVADPALVDTVWKMLSGRTLEDPTVAGMVRAVAEAAARHRRDDIADAGKRYGFFAAPVYDMTDVLKSPRLRRRGAFVSIAHPLEEAELDVPISFARVAQATSVAIGPPPRLGADTLDVLGGCTSLDDVELAALFAQEVI